jgi:hypothetical protein
MKYILIQITKEKVIPGSLLGSKCGGITKASCADVERFRTASSGFCFVANTEHCRSPSAAPKSMYQSLLKTIIFSYPSKDKAQI